MTRHLVLIWLCLAATIAYVCRNSIGVAESTIRRELGLTELQMGWVMSAFFITYSLGQIPGGIWGQAWGSRLVMPILSAGWSLATAAMSIAFGLPLLIVTRLANGFAQAGLFPCAVNSIAKWFPASERAFATGALAAFMSLGGAGGVALTGLLLEPLGWRWTFVAFCVPGLVWAAGFYLWFRDRPHDHPRVRAEELERIDPLSAEPDDNPTDEPPGPTPWNELLTSPGMWYLCAQHFFRGAGYIFFATWFATYLQETRNVTTTKSGVLTALPVLAYALGGLSGGLISDWVLARTGSRGLARRVVSACGLFACAGIVLLAYVIEDPVLAVLVISAGSFCAAIPGPCGYAITIDLGGKHVAPVFATYNMWGNIGSVTFPLAVPMLLEITGDWNHLVILFAGLHAAAAVCWLLLDVEKDVVEQSFLRRTRSK